MPELGLLDMAMIFVIAVILAAIYRKLSKAIQPPCSDDKK